MSLNFHPKDYNKWHSPLKTVKHFFNNKLAELGWDKLDNNDVVMDLGCGPGTTTIEIILPFFSKVKRIIGLDVMPGMITEALEKHADRRIEYAVADIAEWSNVEQWEGKISKIVSIHCFHWIENQDAAFRNVYRLLKPGGEAAIFFMVEASFYDVIEKLQNSSKWCQYLKGHENRIPDSHRHKYDAFFYKRLVGIIGFAILHCKEEEKIDYFSDDETMKNFCSSLCVLSPYVPQDLKEDFENDILQELIKINGRSEGGQPRHKGKVLEMIIRKK